MISVHIALYRNAFHGLRDTGEPDWPPSPRRLLGALLAGAYALGADDVRQALALRVLKNVCTVVPPVIDAPRGQALRLPGTYTQKTSLPDTTGSGAIAAYLDVSLLDMMTRTRVLKPQNGIALAGRDIVYYIDIDCDASELEALNAAAQQVPYFGTSKDPADLSVRESGDGMPAAALVPYGERWYPRADASGAAHGWQINTIDWFESNFQRTFAADPEIARLPPISHDGFVAPLRYSRNRETARHRLRIVPLVRSIPHHRVATLISGVNEALEVAQGRGNVPEWQAFPITVSHEMVNPKGNGDGRCVGVGVIRTSAPGKPNGRGGPDGEPSTVTLVAKHIETVSDDSVGLVVGPSRALREETWIGPATSWYSTTPLRAFPDERVVRFQLAAEVLQRFNVTLERVTLSKRPRLRRNGYWSNGGLADGLTQWWAELTFSEEVTGPILLGAETRRGFGVFRPKGEK